MKKAISLAILTGCFATGSLHAAGVDIHIAGSTAFRANAFRAIRAAYDGQAPATMNPSTASGGTSTVTFTGTMSNLFGSQTVTVYCAYNGSVQGLGDINNNTSISFLQASGTNTVSAVPDITFSDVDRNSTLFPNVATTETHIAVLPFVYCRNYYSPASVTNVTAQQLTSLWNNGHVALSFFTGLATDDTNNVFISGRNLDSGTRVTGSADAFYIGTPILWGFNTTFPTTWAVLNQNLSGSLYGAGYSSGGNEAAALTNQNAGGACIGYEGLNDALTVAGSASTGVTNLNGGGGCSIIAYEGALPFLSYTPGSGTVPAKPDFTPIIKGQYDFWSYECLETLSTHSADTVYQYYTNMVTAIDADIAAAEAGNGNSVTYGPVTAIRLSEMKVTRNSVGSNINPPIPTYP